MFEREDEILLFIFSSSSSTFRPEKNFPPLAQVTRSRDHRSLPDIPQAIPTLLEDQADPSSRPIIKSSTIIAPEEACSRIDHVLLLHVRIG